jgi:plasmid stabilization system protein ParE
MAEVEWTSQAFRDLQSIAEFIAKDSRSQAQLFVFDVFRTAERIALFPLSGRMVPELKNPIYREIIRGSYRIVYRLKKQNAELLAIHHGARLLNPDELK